MIEFHPPPRIGINGHVSRQVVREVLGMFAELRFVKHSLLLLYGDIEFME